jgi:hypothetical protein
MADEVSGIETFKEDGFSGLSQDELFEKLQTIKKLLDNGLILQGVRRFQERNIEPYVSSLEDESLKEGTAVLTLRL